MRIRSFETNDRQHLAASSDGAWYDLGPADLIDLIKSGRIGDLVSPPNARPIDMTQVRLLPPIPRPGKILCVGLNYIEHAAESPYKDTPKYPAYFPRFSSSLIAAGDPIIRPTCSRELDFEGELVAIVGKSARHVPEDRALDHVAGYSLFNDASVRNYQFLSPQWTPGKNFDGTGAFGPDFVTADELPPGACGLQLDVFVNGTKMQSANTRDMIFSVAKLISLASEFMTLEPGDVVVTGTPAGVGFARNPPIFLKDGDDVEVTIEKIGTLRNPVRDEAA